MISFLCKTDEFKARLKSLRALNKRQPILKLKEACEITLTDGYVQLAIPGAIFGLKCETKGTAKATLLFKNLLSIMNDHNQEQLRVEFFDGSLRFGIVQVRAETFFFKDDSILRTIKLSNNYNDIELLELKNQGYTKEELDFNNLTDNIELAEKIIYSNIRKAAKTLGIYGISPIDIKDLLMKKCNVKLELDEKDLSQLFSSKLKPF